MNTALTLAPLDVAVLLAYFGTLAGIGVWAARRAGRNTEDYFLASRSIPWLITAASFLATCISALTFINVPAEGYASDYRYMFSIPGDIAATLFVASFFLPAYQKLGVTSIYEVMAQRFGRGMHTTCASYFLVTRTLASTVRIASIAKVVEVVSGYSISYAGCLALVLLVILSYTTLGGGRAIAWTDTVQAVLLIGGACVALVYIAAQVKGGFAGVIAAGSDAVKLESGKPVHYNKFTFLEPFNWVVYISFFFGFFGSCAAYGADQDMVQRLLACNDPRKARWSLVLYGLASIPITMLFLTLGVALYAYSLDHPALVAGMSESNHVFPRFIVHVMPAGLRGLLLAALASAAMGSADSALAALATAFTVDLYRTDDQERALLVSKLSYVGFGVLFFVLALPFRHVESLLWLAFRIVTYTYGPLLGAFFVALLTDWKMQQRTMIGLMLAGSCVTIGLDVVAYLVVNVGGATSGFWFYLSTELWKLYVPAQSLGILAGAYLLRRRDA